MTRALFAFKVVPAIFATIAIAIGCKSGPKKVPVEVDSFAVGSAQLAAKFGADTTAMRRLANAKFTAEVQLVLLQPDGPMLITGDLADMELTGSGWIVRIEQLNYFGPDLTYLLDCDSLPGLAMLAQVKPRLDSASFYFLGCPLAVVARIESVSKALYSVDADVYGTGDNVDYSLYLATGRQMIARGKCLGYFLE